MTVKKFKTLKFFRKDFIFSNKAEVNDYFNNSLTEGVDVFINHHRLYMEEYIHILLSWKRLFGSLSFILLFLSLIFCSFSFSTIILLLSVVSTICYFLFKNQYNKSNRLLAIIKLLETPKELEKIRQSLVNES
jgi:hypothetical protein